MVHNTGMNPVRNRGRIQQNERMSSIATHVIMSDNVIGSGAVRASASYLPAMASIVRITYGLYFPYQLIDCAAISFLRRWQAGF